MTGTAMWHSYTLLSLIVLTVTQRQPYLINHNIRASETRANGLCKMESDQRAGPHDHTAENCKENHFPPSCTYVFPEEQLTEED